MIKAVEAIGMTVFLIMIFAAGGCSGEAVFRFQDYQGPYLMQEQGKLKSFSMVGITHTVWVGFWGLGVGDAASSESLVLVDQGGKAGTIDEAKVIETGATPWRLLVGNKSIDLVRLARAVSELEWLNQRKPTIWIIGNEPLVLAVGIQDHSYVSDGSHDEWRKRHTYVDFGTFYLVGENDLKEQVSEVRVLDILPTNMTSPAERAQEEILRNHLMGQVRRIVFAQPTTIQQLLENPTLWKESSETRSATLPAVSN